MDFVREALCKMYKSLIEICIFVEVKKKQIYLNYNCSAPELWTTWKKLSVSLVDSQLCENRNLERNLCH